jgi:tetratricopeptide (TPR) repeat protein
MSIGLGTKRVSNRLLPLALGLSIALNGPRVPMMPCRADDSAPQVPAEPVPLAQERNGVRVLAIGIDAYEDSSSTLHCAASDADEFAKFLAKEWHFGPEGIECVKGSKIGADCPTTATHLDTKIRTWATGLGRSNVAIFYYAGHGTRAADGDVLVPTDGFSDVERWGYHVSKLLTSIQNIGPRRAILIFDNCRKRADTTREIQIVRSNPSFERANRSLLSMMYACKPQESSHEATDLGHGLFTWFLLKGLRGDPDATDGGVLTLESLVKYIDVQIGKETTRRTLPEQHPEFFGDRFVLWAAPTSTAATGDGDLGAARLKNLMQKAWRDYHAGDLEAAERIGHAVLSEGSSKGTIDADAHYLLGRIFMNAKPANYYGAVSEFNQVLSARPSYEPARRGSAEARKALESPSRSGLPDGYLPRWTHGEPPSAAYVRLVADKPDGHAPPGDAEATAAERLADEALLLVTAKRISEAQVKANEALARAPGNARAHFSLGRVYAAQHEYDSAIREYQEALRLNPALAPADFELQQVVSEKGPADTGRLANEALSLAEGAQLGEAESKARWALARDQANATAHFALGLVYFHHERHDDAIVEFNQALKLDPTLSAVGPALEEAQRRANERLLLAEANEAYQLVQGHHFPEAEAHAMAVLNQQPGNSLARLVLGRTAEESRRYDAAIKEYQEALQSEPSLDEARAGLQRVVEAKPGKRDVKAILLEAGQLLRTVKWDQSEPMIREVLAREPDNAQAHVFMGSIFVHGRRYDEAIGEYLAAQTSDPKYPGASEGVQEALVLKRGQEAVSLTRLAYRHLSRREFLDARQNARKAVALDPKNAEAHAVLGVTLLWLEDTDRAEDELRQAEAIQRDAHPNDELPLVQIARGTRSWMQAREISHAVGLKRNPGQPGKAQLQPLYEDAAKAFRKALDLDGSNIIALNNLGAVLYELGKLDTKNHDQTLAYLSRAEEAFQRAIDLDKYHVAYHNLGNAYLEESKVYLVRRRKDDTSQTEALRLKAERAFQDAIDRYPSTTGSKAQLAMTLLLEWKDARHRDKKMALRDRAIFWARRAREEGLTDHPVFKMLRDNRVRL